MSVVSMFVGACVVGGALWVWSLARVRRGPALLGLYSLSIPWADTLPLPAPGPLSSPSSILAALTVAVIVLSISFRPDTRSEPHRVLVPFTLVAGLAVTSVVWSETPLDSLEESALLLAAMVVFVAVCGHHFTRPEIRFFETATVVGGASASAFAFLQAQLGALSVGNSGVPRFETVGGDPNATAASLLLPLAIGFGRAIDRSLPTARRLWWAAGSGSCLLGIFLTVSRGALLAAGVAVLALLVADRRWLGLVRIGAGAVIACVVALAAAPDVVVDRLLDTSSTGRIQIWRLGLSICRDTCDVGSGFGTFPRLYREEFLANPSAGGYQSDAFKAHNTPLQLAVETGVIGALVFVIGVAMVVLVASRLPPLDRPAGLVAAVSWVVTTNLITNINFKYYWLVPAYVVALTAAAERQSTGVGDARRAHEPARTDAVAAATVPVVPGGSP